jgi:hypothetical protein
MMMSAAVTPVMPRSAGGPPIRKGNQHDNPRCHSWGDHATLSARAVRYGKMTA